ncbi:MAG TPA: 3'(2'),5'-bisphosphate nucleotidase CysQ [Frankiaceae bacterium]|nr:3'(2'),5'-bisphosphate nucleotidase CysQ [Frankiaceae bacterium]
MIDAPDPSDADLAGRLATDAVLLLESLRAQMEGQDVDAVRNAGDRRSHEFLMAAFAAHRPGDAVLSEEGVDDPVRLTADRVWIVDPLDGTREFGEGRSDWAVHVALWTAAADDVVLGAVGLPGGVTLTSDPAPFTPSPSAGAPRVVASRTRAPAVVEVVVDALDGVMVPLGSAGAKIAAVVRGDAEAYVHAGGMWEWDSAAPVAVARAAGVIATRLDGSPLRYNQPHPYLPDLIVARADLAEQVLAAARSAAGT